MKINQLIKIMKVLVILSGIILMLVFAKYGSSNCALCSFDVEGEEVKMPKFMEYYEQECLDEEDVLFDLTLSSQGPSTQS